MRAVTGTLTSAAASNPIPLNIHSEAGFSVGFGIKLGGGTMTYTVQHTFDDPFAANFDPATAKWYNHATVAAIANVDSDGNYAFPVRAVRVNVTAHTSGTLTYTFVQSGGAG